MTMVLVGFLLIGLFDFLPIIKGQSKNEAVAFLILFLPALTLAVLQAAQIEVASIMLILGDLIKSLGLGYK